MKLKFVLSALISVTFSLPAQSEKLVKVLSWNGDTFYQDTQSMEVEGATVRIFEILDRSEALRGSRSTKRISEYRCQEGQWRILIVAGYAEKMALGKPNSHFSTPSEWQKAPQGSVVAELLRSACEKLK